MMRLFQIKSWWLSKIIARKTVSIDLGEWEPRYDINGELFMLWRRK